jgi:hypothetical protein
MTAFLMVAHFPRSGKTPYRSAEIEAKLKAEGYNSRIDRRAYRNHPLSERETQSFKTKPPLASGLPARR